MSKNEPEEPLPVATRLYYGSQSAWSTAVTKRFMFDPSVSMEARALWVALKLFLSPDRTCVFPGQKLIAEITGWHRATIWRRMSELIDAHYLACKQFAVGKANIYVLFEDPKDWRDPSHWTFTPDGALVLGDEDQGDPLQNDGCSPATRGCSPATRGFNGATRGVAAVQHAVLQPCNTQDPQNSSHSPEDQPLADVTGRRKNIHIKKKPIEEKAASPLTTTSPPSEEDTGLSPDTKPRSRIKGEEEEESELEKLTSPEKKQEIAEWVMEFGKTYPKFLQLVLNVRNVLMTEDGRQAAREFFYMNPDWSEYDAMYVGLKAAQVSLDHPYSGKGIDPYWHCRRFTYPNRLFSTTSDEEPVLIKIARELNFVPRTKRYDDVFADIQELVAKAKKNRS